MNYFGLWKEYGWIKQSNPIIEDIPLYEEGKYQTDKKFIDYLESGIPIVGLRTNAVCYFTEQNIGVVSALTDGVFAWTRQYIHYLKEGVIELDSELEVHIIDNSYQLPSRGQIGIERLRIIQGAIIEN